MVKRGFSSFYSTALADEVATLQRLTAGGGHVNVVRASMLWLSPTYLAIQQDYLTGGTLEEYQRRRGSACADGSGERQLAEWECAYFLRQLCAALEFCHSRRIVFRDVKPSNCLLDGSEPPLLRLCDFGVSRTFSKKNEKLSMHTIAGTPGFLSPDVMGLLFLRGAAAGYDGRRADVWSAGAVLCKLATGHLPYGFEDECVRALCALPVCF